MLPGGSKIGPKRFKSLKMVPRCTIAKKNCSPSMFARPFWTPKCFLGGPWAPEGGPKDPKRPENTSPKAPQRGPKGAQEGSQDNFDVLTWKNARHSEYSVIYDTKCMSELSTPIRKSPKIGPRDQCFAYLHAHCSRKRSKSAPEPKKVAIRSVFLEKRKYIRNKDAQGATCTH